MSASAKGRVQDSRCCPAPPVVPELLLWAQCRPQQGGALAVMLAQAFWAQLLTSRMCRPQGGISTSGGACPAALVSCAHVLHVQATAWEEHWQWCLHRHFMRRGTRSCRAAWLACGLMGRPASGTPASASSLHPLTLKGVPLITRRNLTSDGSHNACTARYQQIAGPVLIALLLQQGLMLLLCNTCIQMVARSSMQTVQSP